MNKKRITFLSISSLSILSLLFSINSNDIKGANASAKSQVLINDTFNSKTYAGSLDSSIWTDHSSSKIKQSDNGEAYLNFTEKTTGGEHIVFSTMKKIENINYFQFDFKFESATKWATPLFMKNALNSNGYYNTSYAYEGTFSLTQTSANSFLEGTLSKSFDFKSVLSKNANESWITVRIDSIDSMHAKVNFKLQSDDVFLSENERTVTAKTSNTGNDFKNAYLGVVTASEVGSINFDNFIVNYGDNKEIKESFDNFDFEEYKDFGFFKKDANETILCTIKDSSFLELNGTSANDFIISKNQISSDTSIIEEVEIANLSLNVKFPITSSEEKIGLFFGLDKEGTNFLNNGLVYEINNDTGILKEYVDGVNVLDETNNTNKFKNIKGPGSDINIKIYKSGTFLVYENDKLVTKVDGTALNFDKVHKYTGYFALGALSDINVDVQIDNVKLVNTFYYVPVTKSVTHNFSNNFFGNKGYEDFVVMNGDGGGKLAVEDGKLVFNCGTDGTFFGSAHQYDDFILDFKLCSVLVDLDAKDGSKLATAPEKWLGLDLSRETKYYGSYGRYATLLTQITPNKDYGNTFEPALWCDSAISSFNKDDVTITTHKQIDISMMEKIQYTNAANEANVKEGDAICFRFVSSNGNLKMYLKTASEVTYTLYYEVDGLELNGYFALCCTGYTFIKIDDFSMTNTSSVYVCADNEAPETITEKETEIIYDKNNVDVNLNEELSLNKKVDPTLIAFIVVSSIEALAIVALGVITLKKGKKKHE